MTRVVRVEGLRQLLRITDAMPKQIRKDVRDELRATAEPVRQEAQTRFLTYIDSNPRKSRYGISVRKAGTIAVEQRVKSKLSRGRPELKRPAFVELQFAKALDPAAEHGFDDLVDGLNDVLEHLERKWAVGV